MNIREFRAVIDAALARAGFTRRRFAPGLPWVWILPGSEVTPFLVVNAQRRPWGFTFYAYLGLELPALRAWLVEHKGAKGLGSFALGFRTWYSLNDDRLSGFQVLLDDPISADDWCALYKQVLEEAPTTIDSLLAAYRDDRARLGLWADRWSEPAWDFLANWRENPSPSLKLPRPTGTQD